MGASNTLKFWRKRIKEPSSYVIRLQGPMRHSVRHRHDRERIARRELIVRPSALQGIYVREKVHMRKKNYDAHWVINPHTGFPTCQF